MGTLTFQAYMARLYGIAHAVLAASLLPVTYLWADSVGDHIVCGAIVLLNVVMALLHRRDYLHGSRP